MNNNCVSGEKYLTMSLVIPLIRGFQYTMRNLSTQIEIGDELRNKLLETITRGLLNFEKKKIVAKACFLDPRFKKYAFGLEENANLAQKPILNELTGLISKKIQQSGNRISVAHNTQNECSKMFNQYQVVFGHILTKNWLVFQQFPNYSRWLH